MNRSGNIGAAKNMDSVFDNFTDEELEQDLMFDEDDQLVEIVEGYTGEGNTVFEEDEEIFKIADEIMNSDNAGDSPAEVKKDTEDILGPDSKTDMNIKDIEDVEKTKLDDSQTIANLNKNGESEADKELGLDKLEDEYHSTSTVDIEEAYEKWLHENPYEYDKENEAEGTDDTFGSKIDNSEPTDDLKNTEDENYQKTADASVKENAGDLGDENKAEGTNTKFGSKIDNSDIEDDLKNKEDENYQKTNDASIEEAFEKWLNESEEYCDCGKDDCPICNPKKEDLAPAGAPTEDKTGTDRHEESNNETISNGNGEGIATAGQVDDNSAPKPDDMTPEGSPESDNGDIMNDGEKISAKTEEPVSDTIEKEPEAETPITDESDKGESKEDADIEDLEEAFNAFLNEAEDVDDNIQAEDDNAGDASTANDEACGKGSELDSATNDGTTSENECGGNVPANGPDKAAGVDNVAQVAESAPETDPDLEGLTEGALPERKKAAKDIARVITNEIRQTGENDFKLVFGGFMTAGTGSSKKFLNGESDEFHLLIQLSTAHQVLSAATGTDSGVAGPQKMRQVIRSMREVKDDAIQAVKDELGYDIELKISATKIMQTPLIDVKIKNIDALKESFMTEAELEEWLNEGFDLDETYGAEVYDLPIDENYNICFSFNEAINGAAIAKGATAALYALDVIVIAKSIINGIKRSIDKSKINKSLANYEAAHKDMPKLSDMKVKVFKLNKQLSGSNNAMAGKSGKGKEQKGLLVKLFGPQVRENDVNRVVEYSYKGKPVMLVAFTKDKVNRKTYQYEIYVSYTDAELKKYDDYYMEKLAANRGLMTKNTDGFVAKYLKGSSVSESCEGTNGKVEIPCPDAEDAITGPISNNCAEEDVPETKLDGETPEDASKGLNEADEVEVPTQADVKDAASVEADDTAADIDAAIADSVDATDSDADVDIPYDPNDEELIDLDEAFEKWLNS